MARSVRIKPRRPPRNHVGAAAEEPPPPTLRKKLAAVRARRAEDLRRLSAAVAFPMPEEILVERRPLSPAAHYKASSSTATETKSPALAKARDRSPSRESGTRRAPTAAGV